jgi:hypothetical protein
VARGARPADSVENGTKRTCRDGLFIVRFWREADMPRPPIAYRSAAYDPDRSFAHSKSRSAAISSPSDV